MASGLPSSVSDRARASRPTGTGSRRARIRDAVEAGASTPRVAILGAGASGLAMGIQLLEHGIETFTIYEKSDGVGGTWRDNTYPGAACDVPSHLYSLSFAPKKDWTRKFAAQPEILAYFESLVPRFGLEPHLRTGVKVTDLVWDEDNNVWRGSLRDEHGGTGSFEADVVVSGLGQLNQPHVPDIPGMEDFTGTMFHSARWNHDHDLRGERVAVIGIGASAIQFVPQVARVARSMTLFQRSVNYVIPKPDREFRSWERWLLVHIPGLEKLYRESIYWRFEARFGLMRKGSRVGAMVRRKFAERVSVIESERLPRGSIVPDYSPGCRRLLIANDWYPTLLMDSVDVVTHGVERITEDGVVADGVEYPADTIIFGTGFRSTEFLAPMDVTGRGGVSLSNVWRDGAKALLGLSVPEFPNFFMLYGPNTNLGHNSILFMVEQQISYILQIIGSMVTEGVVTAEVTGDAMDRFDAEIRDATKRTVWDEECSSWYKNESGRITNNWPDYTVRYRRRMSHVDESDWILSS